MDIDDYQAEASGTLQFDVKSEDATSIALLGITGETGELASEFKKRLRDGKSYEVFTDKLVEELGDILWYVSLIATIEGVQLSDVLKGNLAKAKERWGDPLNEKQFEFEREFVDDGLPEDEKLPREFVAEFTQSINEKDQKCTEIKVNGTSFGDPIRDNSYDADFYRFHDVFHLAYATVLGWSPVVRKFLKRKRKDISKDEIEDGGRASVVDEAISILVFEYASSHRYFEGVGAVDYELLRAIKMLTRNIEIKHATEKDWQHAILLGFEMWRKLRDFSEGRIICNMYEKTMMFEKL